MRNVQQEKLQQQLEFNRNKVAIYDKGRTAIGIVNKTLSGEAVNAEEFNAQLKLQVVEGNEKAKDAWDVLQSILTIAGQKDPNQFFAQEVTFAGIKYKRAEIAVGFAGRVYEVVLDVEASELGKPNKNFIVSMGQYKKGTDGKYRVENLTPDALTVSQQGEKLSIDLTSDMSPDVRKAQFGDENFSLKLEERIFMAYDHQQKPITVLAGLKESNQAPKPAQLVTAGTGTGKTAMLAGYAKGLGRGIFAVPKKLVTDMQKDANGFLATKPAVLDDKDIPGTPEQLEALLQKNPYLVVSHEQLLQMSSVMRGQDIFIDEAHELTINPDNSVALDKIKQLKELGENNLSVAVTATPTQALYELYGKEVIDVSLYMAQHELHSVRQVEVLDRKAGRKGHDNNGQVVHQTLAMALGHEWSLRSGDKGYIDHKLVKGQSDPAAYAYERNRHTGVSVQGIIFTDDPKVSDKLAASMQQIYEGKYPADNLGRLQRETAIQRLGNQKQITRDDRAEAKNVELRAEMMQAQRNHLADSINIAVLLKLNPSLKEKNLQKLARSGDLEKDFNKQLMANQSALDIPKALKLLEEERQKLANPNLDAYFDEVKAQIEKVGKNLNRVDSLAVKPIEINPQELGAQYLVVLRKNTTEKALENAKQLLDRGLVEKVISEGPLGTGYSNSNVLSTVVVQTKNLAPGKTIERNQQLGRPIRDDDRRAFAGTVIDANVDHRIERADEVYSRQANTYYQQGIAKEGILQKQHELRQEQEAIFAKKKEASKQRVEEMVKQRGDRSYADVVKGVKAKAPNQEIHIK